MNDYVAHYNISFLAFLNFKLQSFTEKCMDCLVEYSKTIYFHRASNVWLRNTEILSKQKGVLPFSKVTTFTLKTLEFSGKLSILLQFKTIFRPVTKSKWGIV